MAKQNDDKQKREPISIKEVNEFAKKMEGWSEELSPKERALVHLILARASGSSLGDVEEYVPELAMSEEVAAMLREVAAADILASAWVEAGDPWIQSGGGGGWVKLGDPWIQSGGSRLGQVIRVQTGVTELGRFLNPSFRR